MNEETRQKTAGYLGLAARAGRIAAGDRSAKEALVRGKACLLVIADDAAPKVRLELSALAGEEVPIIAWSGKDDLGRIVGKSRRGALAVLDQGFAHAIMKLYHQ